MSVGLYELLLLAHVLLFVYWLGADLAVLYSARYVADPTLSLQTRETVSQIMAFVDLFPRLSVPLIGAVGASLGVMSGEFLFGTLTLVALWGIAGVWVTLNLWLYLNRGNPLRTAPWRRFDVAWRSLIGTGVLLAGLVALAGAGVTDNRSLALKLLVFSAAVFLSLVLRRVFMPFRPALQRIASGAGGDADVAIMQRTLSRTRPIVLGIWGLTVAAAALGLWQPV